MEEKDDEEVNEEEVDENEYYEEEEEEEDEEDDEEEDETSKHISNTSIPGKSTGFSRPQSLQLLGFDFFIQILSLFGANSTLFLISFYPFSGLIVPLFWAKNGLKMTKPLIFTSLLTRVLEVKD